MPDLLEQIAAIVGPQGLLTGEDVSGRASDFMGLGRVQAKAIVRPTSAAELSAVMKLCHAQGQVVVPAGGYTGLVQGTLCQPGDIQVSLERMRSIEEIDPIGRTATVGAGCPVQAVQDAAAEHGLQFAVDWGARGSATIGGGISTNAGGNSVIRYGMMRDSVLGLEAVLADGTVISAMNCLIKNNAAYDLKHLFIGSEGTLGIVTRAVLKLQSAPLSTQTALIALEDFAAVQALFVEAGKRIGSGLTAFEVMWANYYEPIAIGTGRHTPPLPGGHGFYVIVEMSGTDPDRDAAQFEEVLAGLRARGVEVLGDLQSSAGSGPLVERAAALRLKGIVIEGDWPDAARDGVRAAAAKASMLVIELPSRARIRLDSGDRITGTSQALWPGLEIEHSGKTIAGPTSAPWIHTNGGFLRFLRARTGAEVWLGVQPPPNTIFPVERYIQTIGDTAIPGARWIVSLDRDFESRLYRRDAAAFKDWRRIMAHLKFYEQWRAANFGKFGVVIDRSSGGLLSSFLLDMLAAQRTSATVIPPNRVDAKALAEMTVLLDLERESLTAAERRSLDEFIARGGTVLDPPREAKFPDPEVSQITPGRRDLDRLQGLWEMVYNATLRKNFGVRAFNTVGVLTGITTPDRGRSVVVHLLNFTDYEGEAITVHALGNWKSATLHRPEGPPIPLSLHPVKEGTAVEIDRFATAVAIEFR